MPIPVARRRKVIGVPRRTAAPALPSRLVAPLRALARRALALEGRSSGEIGIVLGDDALLRDLNRRYRGLDRATDVLSFPYGDEDAPVDGDIVISIDRAVVQARRFRVSLGRELAR